MIKMRLKTLVIMITEDCNFNCQYCYQTKQKRYMTPKMAKKIIDFFLPRTADQVMICFLGGEPFLVYDLMREVIAYVEEKNKKLGKKIIFSATTNASLLDDEKLDYLDGKHFTLGISFDGLEQDQTRGKSSFDHTVKMIRKAKERPHIILHTASTFNKYTVGRMARSMGYILDMDVPKMTLAVDLTTNWTAPEVDTFIHQLGQVRELAVQGYREKGSNPISLFHSHREPGIWRCSAGSTQVAVTVDGQIWGCACIYERFRNRPGTHEYNEYYFGNINQVSRPLSFFQRRYKKVMENYNLLSMDNFYTESSRCFLCPEVEQCEVCPVSRVHSKQPMLFVDDYVCRVNLELVKQPGKFNQAVEQLSKTG